MNPLQLLPTQAEIVRHMSLGNNQGVQLRHGKQITQRKAMLVALNNSLRLDIAKRTHPIGFTHHLKRWIPFNNTWFPGVVKKLFSSIVVFLQEPLADFGF